MGFVITLIIVGIALLFAEVLLIPGVGLAGILGMISIGGSCYYAFYEFGNLTGMIVTSVCVVLVVLMTIYVLRAKTWKKITLETNIDSKVTDGTRTISVGERGKTTTRLAPMGSARFGDNIVEVKALEGIIDPNVEVEVVLIEDNKIYVKLFTSNN